MPADATPHGRPVFARFWTAATLSSLGTAITAVAMPVLVVQTLGATPLEVGIVNAAQYLPYALVGLLAGVYADRWRRKPILVWASVGRAVALGAIPVLWLLGALPLWALVVLLLLFGGFSVFAFAATQSLLPRIVPRSELVIANARLDQSDAAAQTLGPVLGGGLVGLLGAPIAIAIDALSYLVDAILNAGLRIEEVRTTTASRSLRREIAEGLRWTYRHPVIGPLVASTHTWFFANAAALTALSLVALRTFALSPFAFGLILAGSGVAALVGATIAPAVGRRIGAGRAIIAARSLYPLAWLLVALAPANVGGAAMLAVALALHGLAGGVENANEMGYQQRVTPDALLGRLNATRRSANRTAAAIGAIVAGGAIGLFGDRPTLVGVCIVFAAAAVIVAWSPVRNVRDDLPEA